MEVVFDTKEIKKSVLLKAKKLKDAYPEISAKEKINVNPDLTLAQRKKRKIRDALKQRNAAGETNLWIREEEITTRRA